MAYLNEENFVFELGFLLNLEEKMYYCSLKLNLKNLPL